MDTYDGRQAIFTFRTGMQQISHFTQQGFRWVTATAGERCDPGHDVTDGLNTALHMEKSWFTCCLRSRAFTVLIAQVAQCIYLSRQRTDYKYAKFGIMLIFVDSCYSGTCMGKEEVRFCASDGLWPKPVRTDPFLIWGLTFLHACQMTTAIFYSI